jgi:hypothetical protein
MHGDLEALDVVCMHYRTEYSSDALRRTKKKIRQLRDALTHLTLEVYFLRCLCRVWREHRQAVRSLDE